jgi:hypothetical protein
MPGNADGEAGKDETAFLGGEKTSTPGCGG